MAWTDLTLATERLTLRPFVDDDKPAMISIRSNAETYRHLGGPMDATGVAELEQATVGEQWGVFAVEEGETGEVIGDVVFGRERGELELSYEFHPDRWGHGLAFEAIGAALGWAAAHTDDEHVIAVTQTANTRSVALLTRLGFAHVRTFEEFDGEQGEFRREMQRDPMGG